MAERTQEPSRAPDEERETYDEKAVAQILAKATQLESQRTKDAPRLTLAEIEQVARDAGIDPSLIRRAAREVANRQEPSLSANLLGAPIKYVVERVISAKLEPSQHEVLVAIIREELSSLLTVPPHVSVLGRSLTFGASERNQSVEVQLVPEGDATLLRITLNSRGMAGRVAGGATGITGGLVTPIAFGVGSLLGHASGLPVGFSIGAVAVGFVGTMAVSARAVLKRVIGSRNAVADRLAQRLEQSLTAAR